VCHAAGPLRCVGDTLCDASVDVDVGVQEQLPVDDTVSRFFSCVVRPGKTEKFVLSSSELTLKQACLAGDVKPGSHDHATLLVKCVSEDDAEFVEVVRLRAGATEHARIGLTFFEDDGELQLSVVGTAAIAISGTVCCTDAECGMC
jgi:hypothetical protein